MVLKILFPLLFLVANYLLIAQDHKENLSGPYENVQQIIEECLMCHEDIGDEVLHSNHWNWLSSNLSVADQNVNYSKNHIPVNNFCLAVNGQGPQCITCHLPFSGKDESFDFNVTENIDCLICHDQTGKYVQIKYGLDTSNTESDLLEIAQSVRKPTSNNCGSCHFMEIGGVEVKSGAMDNSLFEPDDVIDYHLGGLGFGCGDCHDISGHNISARTETGESSVACENCHDAAPHEKELLNNHYSAVACQTCHIPYYSRTEPSIVQWDWSKAGENKNQVVNDLGIINFDKTMGQLVWTNNIRPEYYWSDGTYKNYELGEKIEKSKLINLDIPNGKISDAKSKISPFKVLKVKQPYDPVNKYLIIPKIYAEDGYQTSFDWVNASEIGMKFVNLEFSDSVDFIDTKMYWPINHMVMSSDNTLKCTSCHGKGGEGLLNWKQLGYPDDPIKKGGRVKNKLVKE